MFFKFIDDDTNINYLNLTDILSIKFFPDMLTFIVCYKHKSGSDTYHFTTEDLFNNAFDSWKELNKPSISYTNDPSCHKSISLSMIYDNSLDMPF